jgi:transcriptional regulator with XRE-family HTH domain
MIERILEILKIKGMSPSQFADEIGVQRSAISHLVSGRNNPSLDFVLRVLKRFPDVSTDWLLTGEGKMLPGDVRQVSPESRPINPEPLMELFTETPLTALEEPVIDDIVKQPEIQPERRNQKKELVRGKQTERIIIIYNDNTFRELKPE